MALGISIMKGYLIVTICVMIIYAIRHAIFSFSRLYGRQRLYYNDIFDSELPTISVLVPMHNEEKVLHNCLESLLQSDYDMSKVEIIGINDNSTDKTKEILDQYCAKYPIIKALHRSCEDRGKPAGLNDAMKIAKGEICIIFDADYRPSKNMLRRLVVAFSNPEIGAVMGRVIPHNHSKNLLTQLLSLERTAGYQVDQQARYNLKLIPQYGGTVGGFRKDLMLSTGGFNTRILAEDTELTFRLYSMGYKVIYANDAECYEESPETWAVRGRQIKRWSRGHNYTMFLYWLKVIKSKHLTFWEKVDGLMLLFIYAVPILLFTSLFVSLALFYLGQMDILKGWWVLLFLSAYNSYGNFAPFYEIATGMLIDGIHKGMLKLPLMMFCYYFYLWYLSEGFILAFFDLFSNKKIKWDKTERFNDDRNEVVN